MSGKSAPGRGLNRDGEKVLIIEETGAAHVVGITEPEIVSSSPAQFQILDGNALQRERREILERVSAAALLFCQSRVEGVYRIPPEILAPQVSRTRRGHILPVVPHGVEAHVIRRTATTEPGIFAPSLEIPARIPLKVPITLVILEARVDYIRLVDKL